MSAVGTFYNSVINEVIDSLKSQFQEDGLDSNALNELKEIWERKIKESGALEPPKQANIHPATHFTNIMHQNDGRTIPRIATVNNSASRLIKPSGQQSFVTENTYVPRVAAVPVILQNTSGAFRPNVATANFMRNFSTNSFNNIYPTGYTNRNFTNYDFLFEQWLKNDRLRNLEKVKNQSDLSASQVPMVINANQQQGVAVFSQYHNLIPSGNAAHLISDNNNIINLRKNQVDGNDDGSSDDEGDFVNVSDVDPLSVRPPMSNVPPTPVNFKSEIKHDDSDEDIPESEIDYTLSNLVRGDVKQESDDDNDDDDDDENEDGKEEEPLNTDDDISDDDPERIFETDNVIVCQYDKVSRTRNKWKLNFVSGIANLEGRDSVFHKAVGEAEW